MNFTYGVQIFEMFKNFKFISFRTSSWEDIILLSKTSTIGIARRMDGMTHFQQAVFNI